MSLIDEFFRRMREENDGLLSPYEGFEKADDTPQTPKQTRDHLFAKGLLIFAGSYGLISAFLSQFEFTYNYLAVIIVLFVISMILSFIHYKTWIFNISYPAIFVFFTASLIQVRTLANSGFQAVVNVINETYSSHFLMQFTRESTEMIEDRYLTITVLAIFLGFFFAILINLTMFYSMNVHELFNLTFWPLLIGIYIGKYPSVPSLILLIFAYIFSYILKCGGHYHFIDRHYTPEMEVEKHRYGYTFITEKRRKKLEKKKKKHPEEAADPDEPTIIYHLSDSKNITQTAGFSVLIATLAAIILALTVPASERASLKSSGLKAKSDEYVKIFVQNGLYALFNRYEGTGGMSNGMLGGVGSIRPDYEPDLKVTFVPYGYETVYLKGYTGFRYTGDSWEASGLTSAAALDKSYLGLTEGKTLHSMMDAGATPSMHATMLIENLDAATNNMYVPYYIEELPARTYLSDQLVTKGAFALNSVATMEYVPYSQSLSDIPKREKKSFADYRSVSENSMMKEYEKYVYENYLTLPMNFAEDTKAMREEIGVGKNAAEQMSLIYRYFVANYEYTLSPGATPWNKDYVTYFLLEQKKGFCAHFATAGTLLLRSYGIPARYCEGYIITPTAIAERAEVTDYNYDEFFQGENVLASANRNVLSVEVTDGEAHAWVEVYIDGYGWIPYDPTVPSMDAETTNYSDFLSAFSSLLSADPDTTANDTPTAVDAVNSFLSEIHLTDSPILYVFLLASLAIVCFPYMRKAFYLWKEKRARDRDYAEDRFASTISYRYRKLLKTLKKKRPDYNGTLPEELAIFLHIPDDIIFDIQKSLYGKEDLNKNHADELLSYLRDKEKHLLG
ncbi:MAG: transglutaminase-like domain-containing protein [Lachnospiraceae bacterium]|nr:transglutaminase-like domain-containing protein [Lachnospiraceae bacterium]